MSRKRLRSNEGAAAASPQQQPPPATPYFRYTPAPEDERRDDAATNETYLRPTGNLRGRRQRQVDTIDVPAPAEWLCHDAAASTRLRAQAQTELQLLVPRRPSHLPHSERQELTVRDRDAGLVAAVKSTVGNRCGKAYPREMRPGRVLCGGEVLPWGVWPARLRHHEGQSFYREEESDVLRFGDGGGVGRPNYLAGGGGVGRNGGVGGVGVVSEGSIHDELLRRQFPSSSASCPSTYQHQHQHAEEAAVTRLVPDKRGRWAQVEVKTRRMPPTAAAAALPQDILTGCGTSPGRPPSPPPGTPATEPAPTATDSGDVVKCLIPSRFGGWVEFEEKVADRARNSTEQRQRRRAAATRTARFGPDGSGGAGVPDAALPSSYLEEEKHVRRMVAEAAVVAATTAAREAQQQRREGSSQHQEQEQEHGQGARVGSTMDGTIGQGGGGGLGDGGGSWRSGVAMESAEGMRRKTDGDDVVAAASGGCGKGRADDEKSDDDEKRHGCCRQGWTVSKPAKDTVRRVWNRARRRARDSSEARHRASRASYDNHEDGAAAAAAADGGAIRDDLDAGLLSCLGRECEGVIDAALHVILGDRLRLLRQSSSSIASSTQAETQNSKLPPLPPPPPPPLVTADWQDVLRAMRNCSEGARGVRTTAAIATAAAAQRGGGRQSASSGATAGRGGRNERTGGAAGVVVRGGGGPGERGGEGVPGQRGMKRTVWGAGDSSDGSVVVVSERLPGLPLNEAVLTRAYNRLLLYLHEKKTWHA